jgi:ZIP family zinc transporter
MAHSTLLTVALYSLLTAVATGLGAIPFFFVKSLSRFWLGFCNALAAGLMLGASLTLVVQGSHHGLLQTSMGVLVGVIFIALSGKILKGHEVSTESAFSGADLRKMVLIVGILTIHSFAEGVSIGFGFGSGLAFGLLIAISLAVHNIPEGLAVSLVLVPRGVKPWKAALWSIFTSLPQPIMAIPAFLFVNAFHPILPYGLGFAAGAMCWVVAKDLIPEAHEDVSGRVVTSTVIISAIAMFAFAFVLTPR